MYFSNCMDHLWFDLWESVHDTRNSKVWRGGTPDCSDWSSGCHCFYCFWAVRYVPHYSVTLFNSQFPQASRILLYSLSQLSKSFTPHPLDTLRFCNLEQSIFIIIRVPVLLHYFTKLTQLIIQTSVNSLHSLSDFPQTTLVWTGWVLNCDKQDQDQEIQPVQSRSRLQSRNWSSSSHSSCAGPGS